MKSIQLAGVIMALLTMFVRADDSFPVEKIDQTGPLKEVGVVNLKVTFAEGAPSIDEDSMSSLLWNLRWRPAAKPDVIALTSVERKGNQPIGNELHIRVNVVCTRSDEAELPQETRDAIMKDFIQRLQKFAKADEKRPVAQVRERLAQIDNEIQKTQSMIETLQSLTTQQLVSAAQAGPAGRIKALEAQLNALEATIASKRPRSEAIERALSEQRKAARAQQSDDAISLELKKLVEFREQEVARMEQMYKTGTATNGEISGKKAEVAEARVRLLEREAAVSSIESSKKLADELAMIYVDMMELQIQKSDLQSKLEEYRAALTDEKVLEKLAAQSAVPTTQPALIDRLTERRQKLQREKFQLQIFDVQPET